MARHLLARPHHADEAERRDGVDDNGAPGRGDTQADTQADMAGSPSSGERVTPALLDDYRGTNWGACFFGWLVAVGVTLLLGAVVGAIASAVGASQDWTLDGAKSNAATAALTGLIALGVVEFVGYYAGGYVAGRMSRFDAGRQGLGVWLIGLLTLVIGAGLGAIFGDRYGWMDRVDRSSINLTDTQAVVGGIIAVAAILALMLVGALLGSAVGGHYHRRIDRVIVER